MKDKTKAKREVCEGLETTLGEYGTLVKHAEAIRQNEMNVIEAILDTGRRLTECRDLLSKHDNGTFQKWVKESCGFSRSTAYRYIGAFEKFGKDCPTVGQSFDSPTAMYMLSEASTPEAAVEEATEIVESGGTVTKDAAKKIKAKHEPPAEPTAADELPDDMTELWERSEEVRARLETERTSVEKCEAKAADLDAEIADLENKLSKLQPVARGCEMSSIATSYDN